ncbi:centromere protein L-like [Leptopilina heterotoma]|uniref:centromere protein L-like n=1 Tax=Leptopilina heterotoma TaxID=63436 RepID=UPI001CA88B04|nr:centromere protein L-like [Leptopilina heterotoma]
MEEDQNDTLGRTLISITTTSRRRTRQFFSFREIDQNEPIEYDESFEELVKKTWTLWGVSSLFNFQYDDEIKMKMYAKKLREEVARSILKENVSYTAKFTQLNNFGPKPSPKDAPAIRIDLFATLGTVETCVYTGFLISWRTSTIELINHESVSLPLLLCKGTQSTIGAVHSVLSRMFDCIVTPLPINEHDLKWLTAINLSALGSKGKSKDDLMIFEYVVPRLSIADTINVKFTYRDLRKLWTNVCVGDEESEQTIRIECVEKLFKITNRQMLELAGLNLGLCRLHKLSLPAFSIVGNRMKVMNAETLNNILLFLNEIALEVAHIYPLGDDFNSSSVSNVQNVETPSN